MAWRWSDWLGAAEKRSSARQLNLSTSDAYRRGAEGEFARSERPSACSARCLGACGSVGTICRCTHVLRNCCGVSAGVALRTPLFAGPVDLLLIEFYEDDEYEYK